MYFIYAFRKMLSTLFPSWKIKWKTRLSVMVFSATFNNISVISWRSDLLVEETGVLGETSDRREVIDKFYYIKLYRAHLAWEEFERTTSAVIGTDCTCSYKSNYHTITTTTTLSESVSKFNRKFLKRSKIHNSNTQILNLFK